MYGRVDASNAAAPWLRQNLAPEQRAAHDAANNPGWQTGQVPTDFVKLLSNQPQVDQMRQQPFADEAARQMAMLTAPPPAVTGDAFVGVTPQQVAEQEAGANARAAALLKRNSGTGALASMFSQLLPRNAYRF